MLRVLLVTDTDKPIGDLRQALARLGYEMLPEAATPAALPKVVERERPDVVIIDTESPSRDTLEQLAVMNKAAPRPVLMFSSDADQQFIRAAVGAGVTAYLVEGLAAERLAPIRARGAVAPAPSESGERTRRAQDHRPGEASPDGTPPDDRAGGVRRVAQAGDGSRDEGRRSGAPARVDGRSTGVTRTL
jgi:response regulator NasT